MIEAAIELFVALVSLAVRTGIVVVATPFVFLWPRQEKSQTYWQAVGERYKRVFGWALF